MNETPEEMDTDDPPADTPGVALKNLLAGLLEDAQEYTRRKPLEGLLISFILGMAASNLLRRGR